MTIPSTFRVFKIGTVHILANFVIPDSAHLTLYQVTKLISYMYTAPSEAALAKHVHLLFGHKSMPP